MSERGVPPLTAAELARRAVGLAPCAPAAPSAAWPEVRLRAIDGTIRLPPGFAESPADTPDSLTIHLWRDAGGDELVLMSTPGGRVDPSVNATAGACALRLLGGVTPLGYAAMGPAGADSAFAASALAVDRRGAAVYVQLSATRRAAFDALLSAVASIRAAPR